MDYYEETIEMSCAQGLHLCKAMHIFSGGIATVVLSGLMLVGCRAVESRQEGRSSRLSEIPDNRQAIPLSIAARREHRKV